MLLDSLLDKLLAGDPAFQERLARAREQGKLEGEIKGEIKGAQKAIIGIIEARFPALVELAKQQVVHIHKTEDLSKLSKLIVSAPDENVVRRLLTTYTA